MNLFPTNDEDDDQDEELAEEEAAAEAAEEAADFARPPIGAVTPIRDLEDEPYVFRFEVGPAILMQLWHKLDQLEVRPLAECLKAGHPGFYQLFLDGKPVYIGKSARPIGERLKEHKRKFKGRISLDRIGCKFAYVEDASLVSVSEGTLIKYFTTQGVAEWNRSGFGSKTTGFGRSNTEAADWDEIFPSDLNWMIEAGANKPLTLGKHVRLIAKGAPIPFSIPQKLRSAFNSAHADAVNIPVASRPFSEWADLVEQYLAPGWTIIRQPRAWYIVPTS